MALAPRPSISQGVQIGAETTEGTAVAANKKLQSIGFEIGVSADIAGYRPSGTKYKTIHALGKEWTEGSITGQPAYDELAHLFCGLLKNVSPTGPTDTSAYTWTFAPAASTEDTVKTFTIEQGGSVRAHKAAGCRINSVTLTFDRSAVSISGDLFGRAISDGITMTASPTLLPQVPLLPADVAVFLDSTFGALGTTRLTGVLSAEVAIGDRFSPLWTVNDALTSYAAAIETEPSATVKLKQNADADAMGLLSVMQAGSTRFLRVEVTSSTLAGATTAVYKLTMDFAVQIAAVEKFSDEDGVYSIGWEFAIVNASTWGKPMNIVVVNKQASL